MDITTISQAGWLGLLALLGGGATWLTMQRRRKKSVEENIRKQSWEELLKNQIAVEVFDDKELAKWIRANRAAYTQGRQMLLVRCTEDWMTKLGYMSKTGIDADKNVIACIIDMANGEIICAQLFNFGTMHDKTAERFRDKDELFLSDN